jgi:hypothetical protein
MKPLTTTVEIVCPDDATLIERYALMLREVRALAGAASLESLIDTCELAVLEQGREVNRATLEHLVQTRLADAEKKGTCVAAPAVGPRRIAVRANGRS